MASLLAQNAPRTLFAQKQLGRRSRALVLTFALLPLGALAQQPPQPPSDPFGIAAYKGSCAVCHGANLEGAAQGTPLAGVPLKHGDSVDRIAKSIADGIPQSAMPQWSKTLDATQIRRLALYIAERRSDLSYTDFKVAAPPAVPTENIHTEVQTFRIETFASGLNALPYSIAPLPDGSLLLTEKTRGLSIVSPDGKQSALIRGTPQAFDDGFKMPGVLLVYGLGYLLDAVPHPEYRKNGWIYLSYTERCSNCNEASRKSGRPVSMNALIRGRIKNGEWVDRQTIWHTDMENYTPVPDMAAGGRIAFDDKGHVFMSIGIKAGESAGIQDLGLPYGKIVRVNDDGTIPADNPFVHVKGAIPSLWTYGHRTPEGLQFNRATHQLWETEMGQRGGDKVNLLLPGKNYGWPLVSRGLKYDGTPVDYGKELGIAFDPKDLQPPIVDLTPSPAVSNFAFYDGAAFPHWHGNMIVSTLKATELYRMVVKDGRVMHIETLLKGLGRIRDVKVGPQGAVYLLLEHSSGGRILRLVPTSWPVFTAPQPAPSPATAVPQTGPSQSSEPAIAVAQTGSPFIGEWTVTAHAPTGDAAESVKVVKTQDGYTITAKLIGAAAGQGLPEAGPGEDIVLDGDRFSYKRTLSMGGSKLVIGYTGVVSGDTFTGTADLGGLGKVPYTGVRNKQSQ
jgi:aldose sugar dehydrogenase